MWLVSCDHPGGALVRLAVVVALAAAASPAAAEPQRQRVELDVGSEYDSNIHRVDATAPRDLEAAPVLRAGLRYRGTLRPSRLQRVALDGQLGGKVFASAGGQSENVMVAGLDASWDRRVPSRGAVVGLHGTYYDAIGFELYSPDRSYEERNFRTGLVEGTLGLADQDGHRANLGAGYRSFVYKANPRFDWQGPGAEAAYQTTLWRGDPDADADAASVDLTLGYRVEQRDYESTARTRACPPGAVVDPMCFAGTRIGRVDLHHAIVAQAIYTGERIYSGSYELEVNDSNSYGESLVRQRVKLGVTSELPGDLYATAEVTVLFNVFLDSFLVAQDVAAQSTISIEEENRNELALHLSREIGDGLEAEARYAWFGNEFATEELGFRRQTVYLGLVYRAGP